MTSRRTPVDRLLVHSKNGPNYHPIYGGYVNAKGLICLVAETWAYRMNFKRGIVHEIPLLNADAQVRFDAAQPGEAFKFCGLNFRRLAEAEIVDICLSGSFRLGFKSV